MNLPDRFDLYSLGLIFLQMVSLTIEVKFLVSIALGLLVYSILLNKLLQCLPEQEYHGYTC